MGGVANNLSYKNKTTSFSLIYKNLTKTLYGDYKNRNKFCLNTRTSDI